jgi:MSHA biogenesis protein MshQ
LLLTGIRYGRMQMANGFGPEFDDLPVNLTAQYWDGSRFISNDADSCSVISAASLNLTNSLTTPVANATTLSGGKTPAAGLLLLAPDTAGSVGATYQVPVWLQYDWNDDGDYSNSPLAEFIFGRYRGNPRQIYWHERF